MSVKSCEKLEKSRVELTVEVSAGDFEAAVEQAYRKQRGQIRMPGFRPGKAPRKMIERAYGEAVFYEEAMNIVLPGAYEAAVKERELDVVGYPKVEVVSVGKEGFTFKADVAVYPEVTLGQYKGLEAPKSEVRVTDEDVTAQLQTMAENNGRMVDQDRPAENGDVVNIDFAGYLNGAPFPGGDGTGFDLAIGSGQFVPGFEEQMVGMSAGEEKDIDIVFPEDYHPDLAGKAVVFHVKVNAVKVKEIPALDDEFAMDVSEFDTLDELREDVRKKLVEAREKAVRREFEDVLMDKVAAGIDVEIPDDMIEAQAKALVEHFARQIQAQGLTLEQYYQSSGSDYDALLEQAMEPAARQVRLDLAMAAIVKAESIEISEDDISAEFQRQADEVKMDVKVLKQYLEEAVVREQLLREKAIAVVADSAKAIKAVLDEAKPEGEGETGDGSQPEN